ncbi:hypothetical protein, unlikely [Trypanosoma brucei gambiense DAL972]|uniref:Uncharacterized protein n=1 Tax=Trypanosoma brucei gambiense (strain MHOM/CI/86/DAL972) TaxID=679716 RepID=D0A4X7_TRYB9|nr:hypothetical protein, unlikely [Trypanosoma brucei gambiense DAL972]CBH16321.1 hypothetical protein, unlikely [Trypanosoma brucei gambiense DAL972]|eukprot:XP_011778585.1 hypothetical protein, unlikely [Trypanosoma brucei gambiense DAL972]
MYVYLFLFFLYKIQEGAKKKKTTTTIIPSQLFNIIFFSFLLSSFNIIFFLHVLVLLFLYSFSPFFSFFSFFFSFFPLFPSITIPSPLPLSSPFPSNAFKCTHTCNPSLHQNMLKYNIFSS